MRNALFVVLAFVAAASAAHAADFTDTASPVPAAHPVANPLEIPPDIINPAISETGD